MRLFVGIPLTLEMKAEVNRFIETNRNQYSGWKWTLPENLHITLKFLGEAEPAQIPLLSNRLREIAAAQNMFPLALGPLGCFPNRHAPRVLWIGITQGAESLAKLAKMIDTACTGLGFAPEDKPFRPHLTIARAGSNGNPLFNETNIVLQSRSMAGSFSLIQSTLLRSGAQYQTIADFNFERTGRD